MTTENKHTPGPWVVRRYNETRDGESWDISSKEYQYGFCQVYNFGSDTNSKTNARLIAAAPDLLEALERLATFEAFTFEGWGDDNPEVTARVEYARAAIAKARGQ